MTKTDPLIPNPKKENEFFKCIFASNYIIIPDMEEVIALAKKKYTWEIGRVVPSNILETGMQKRFEVYEYKKEASSENCINFIKTVGKLPNVYGLVIAEMTIGSKLPKDKWIHGFDEKENLAGGEYGLIKVPDMAINSKGGSQNGYHIWEDDVPAKNFMIVICD